MSSSSPLRYPIIKYLLSAFISKFIEKNFIDSPLYLYPTL